MLHKLIKDVYWFCTDFMINISNLLSIGYDESNFILFLVIFPLLTLFLITLALYQGIILFRLKHRVRSAPPNHPVPPKDL